MEPTTTAARWVLFVRFQSVDGDTIDCVAAHEQHGLDHPLLRTHTVQTEPPEAPMWRGRGGGFVVVPAAAGGGGAATATATTGSSSSSRNNDRRQGAWQTWHHGGHCPRGTVAIRRTTADDVLRARSISRFGRKRRHRRNAAAAVAAARAANAPDVITGNGHEVSRATDDFLLLLLNSRSYYASS